MRTCVAAATVAIVVTNSYTERMMKMSTKITASAILLWVLRALMACLFLFPSFMKLSGQPMMVAEFDEIGLGQWFRIFTGALELIGGVGVLIPRVSPFAALLLLLVDIGAFVAQISILHKDWIHTIVIGLILGALIYLQRGRLAGLHQPST
jgi:putative oxidoreductase